MNHHVSRALLGAALLWAPACIDRPSAALPPHEQSGFVETVDNSQVDKVDLLLEIDNSNSMAQNQANMAVQLDRMIERLTNPPLGADGMPMYPPVRDMHVGVISSDLGTGTTPNFDCSGSGRGEVGDDGLINALGRGPALATHRPPASVRGADCGPIDQTPVFLAFDSSSTNVPDFSRAFRCEALLHIGGCFIEQQLESAYRALVTHRADDHPGNTDPNAGFLRDDALLAIVILSDEEDGSVRDCQHAEPGVPCDDARDAYDGNSTRWSTTGLALLNERFYAYQPGSPQDPTWPLERYVDPGNLSRGFMGLKPGHPERIVFAAITGIPLGVPPTMRLDGTPTADWNALLGAPAAGNRDDFVHRDTTGSFAGSSPLGTVSMRQANIDARCPERVVPACRRDFAGHVVDPTGANCTYGNQYFALPSRRIVEIARRFDESAMCNGAACQNGVVTSVCSDDYRDAMDAVVSRIQRRLVAPCLPHVLQQRIDPTTDQRTVDCSVRETFPVGRHCSEVAGRTQAVDPVTHDVVTISNDDGVHEVCEVQQLSTTRDGALVDPQGTGWYYDRAPSSPTCMQHIAFAGTASSPAGSVVRLDCIQSVSEPTSVTGATM